MPLRNISATYAPLLMPKARMATGTLSILTEPKMTKYMISSCTMVGVPRMTVR